MMYKFIRWAQLMPTGYARCLSYSYNAWEGGGYIWFDIDILLGGRKAYV